MVLSFLFGFFMIVDVMEDVEVEATTLVVDVNGGGNYNTIQAAINAANPGDTIRVWVGTYYENLYVNKTVSLIGNGSENSIIDGGNNGNTIQVQSDWVNITGFKFQNAGNNYLESSIKIISSSNCSITSCVIANNFMGVHSSSSSYILVQSNTFYSNTWGFSLHSSSDTSISDNTFVNNFNGIAGTSSTNNIIENNEISGSMNYAIKFTMSSGNNEFSNNTIINNSNGICIEGNSNSETIKDNHCFNYNTDIFLVFSTNIVISSNTMSSHGLSMGGYFPSHWNTHNIDDINSVGGKPLYYRIGLNGGLTPSDRGQMILVNCNNMIINNSSERVLVAYSNSNIISNITSNVRLESCSGTTIIHNNGAIVLKNSNSNTILNNTATIYLETSEDNIIQGNQCDGESNGIYLYSSSNNVIDRNLCSNNDRGIHLYYLSQMNIISNNTLTSNGLGWLDAAILISTSSMYNKVFFNSISNNYCGIHIHYNSNENIIRDNDIIDSGNGFMFCCGSNMNTIYHNNIINNTNQAWQENSKVEWQAMV